MELKSGGPAQRDSAFRKSTIWWQVALPSDRHGRLRVAYKILMKSTKIPYRIHEIQRTAVAEPD